MEKEAGVELKPELPDVSVFYSTTQLIEFHCDILCTTISVIIQQRHFVSHKLNVLQN